MKRLHICPWIRPLKMPQELILKIHDSMSTREVAVPVGPYSLGRSPDNDVVIDVPGISRRHAVIGHYSDGAQLSDCGSQNGTFVNGQRVTGAVMLNNGDVILLGSVCEIEVTIRISESQVATSAISRHPTIPIKQIQQEVKLREQNLSDVKAPVTKSPMQFMAPFLTTPILAMASITAIVVIALVVILRTSWERQKPDGKPPNPTPISSRSPIPSFTPRRSEEAIMLERIENAVKQLVRQISNDSQGYAFPDAAPLREIKDVLGQSCKSPSLATTLQTISQNRNEFIKLAEAPITPALLAYAVLAETNGNVSNPVSTARLMAPKLSSLRKTFGGGTADSVLIFVAAYPEGVFPKGSHPLLGRIPGDDPMRERNIWSLARRGKFKPGQYEFVLRFIAYGIIADNPQQCGIALPKLVF